MFTTPKIITDMQMKTFNKKVVTRITLKNMSGGRTAVYVNPLRSKIEIQWWTSEVYGDSGRHYNNPLSGGDSLLLSGE